MNTRPVVGNTTNKELLVEIAERNLQDANEACKYWEQAVKAAKNKIANANTLYRGAKYILRSRNTLKPPSLAVAIKTKVDADFNQTQFRNELESHMENYRRFRELAFMCASLVKLAKGE